MPSMPYNGRRAVVVGAGPSGSVCALLLAQKGFDVQVFDKRLHPDKTLLMAHRSVPISLNPRITEELVNMGLTFPKQGFINGLHRRYRPTVVTETGIQKHGAIIPGDCIFGERHEIALNLTKMAEGKRLSHLKFFFSFDCKRVDFVSQEVEFDGPSGAIKAQYDLLVGADGARSVVRDALQAQESAFQVLNTPVKTRYMSFRNLPSLKDLPGPFADAVTPGCMASVVMKVVRFDGKATPEKFTIYATERGYSGNVFGSDEDFACIRGREWEWLDAGCPSSFPQAWKKPLSQQLASGKVSIIGPVMETSSLIGPSVALVGDACHTTTPFFGFGTNLAISDSLALGKAMDFGAGSIMASLKEYNRAWLPHVKSNMTLEKMNCVIGSKEGKTFWQILWGKYFVFHRAIHTVGVQYLPGVIPQYVHGRIFSTELTAVQALRKFQLEAISVMVIFVSIAVRLFMVMLQWTMPEKN